MEQLYIMVRLIEELSSMSLPIVFKGAVVLKTAVAGLSLPTDRGTRDIDADWVGSPPSMEQLRSIIASALLRVDRNLVVKSYRDYGDDKSAGFRVFRNGESRSLFSMDIGMRQNPFYCSYVTVNGIRFVGASPQKIFADKVKAISSTKIFRRSKDVYDLYLLSAMTGFNTLATYNIYRALGSQLEDFSCFVNRVSDLQHAYDKLSDIRNKPDFMTVYKRVYHFVEPFIKRVGTNLTWNGYNWC